VISIALAIVVNLITVAVATGFQKEISEKVSGFGSHIIVTASGDQRIFESDPIRKDQKFIRDLLNTQDIGSVNPVAYKPVILQSEKRDRLQSSQKGDTTYTQQEISGAVLKGVDAQYDLSFFKKHLVSGRLPNLSSPSLSNEIMVSEKIAKDLNLKVGNPVKAFFVKTQPVKREFVLSGIYRTGLEEFDKRMVLGDIRCVQQLNDWGIQASIEISDTLYNGELIVRGDIVGGNGNYLYDWGKGFDSYQGFTICPENDTVIRLVASDFTRDSKGNNVMSSIPDTALLAIKVRGKRTAPCIITTSTSGEISKKPINQTGTQFQINAGEKDLIFQQNQGKGSFQNYVGGFEILVTDWNKLQKIAERVKKKIALIPNEHSESLSVRSIQEDQQDIFVWLGFLDINVVIILTLMILIGIINMGSALFVLILVRSNFIGIMKAMGASDWSIRKIFLYQAGYLILRGMLLGNLIGLTFCILQNRLGIIKLDQAIYYIDKVPINLNLWHILGINILTLVVCLGTLVIPSVVISRINPIKTIKFN
jgi:lipoprotein-releasing system permease protein